MKPIRLLFAAALLLLAACDKEDRYLPVLEFETATLSADAAGGILTVGILTDVAYDVVMPADAPWLKYAEGAQTKAQPTAATLVLEVEKNTTPEPRTAEVIVRATDAPLADTLHISQSGISASADITAEFDPEFAKRLQEEGLIADATRITYADVEGITELKVIGKYDDWATGKGLASLKGIEYFTALTELRCSYNQLTALDVSKNTVLTVLDCYENQLTALDVSRNTALTLLNCCENQLTALDVSKNTALTVLDCCENQLTALDVSKNTALTVLDCYENQLAALDVSKNTALTELYCDGNQLTALDVSKNTALTVLWCYGNQLAALDVSKNTALTELYCDGNQLTALDVSKNTALTELYCDGNQLTALDVSKNTVLTVLDCYENQLTALDVSKNTALAGLSCSNNQLTALDVSENTALTLLSCYENQLTALDVSKNTALKYLYCETNPGKDGIFEISLWPGSGLKANKESWEYDGQPVTVKYLGRE